MPQDLMNIAVYAGIAVAGILTIGMILARLYTRASKEISFVRTGFGGQKVIMNGGALVFPVLHEVIPVNMNTLRLPVQRANEQALITRDRMRVDVIAEFYVRAQPTDEAIANAAQTLGARTMQPEKLKDLVEGKFVDALRSVAAEMSMEELHEKRVEFVQKVQQAVSEDLLKNGLELEAVSLTGLDQTGMEYFNPNNAFDAEGLTRLTEEIEQRKKIRNDIEQDTAVQIKNKNLEAEKESLEIAKEEEYAKLAQERESEQAKIIAERAIEEERIEKERLVKEREIAKNRAVETQDIERSKAVEIADQERDIAISVKSKEQSEAAADADAARAIAVKAEEQVVTSRETEVADRQKQIELIEASKEAETEALGITIAAQAEKVAAADTAEALRERARGQADQERITAEAEAEAEKMRAAAAEVRYAVEATGNKALNDAANLLSSDQIDMKVKLELIDNLEAIIRESAKPMEAIDDIKIIQLDGLNGATSTSVNGEAVSTSGDGNLADKVVSSALKYRAQAPLIDSLMAEVGLKGDDLNGLTGSFKAGAEQTETGSDNASD